MTLGNCEELNFLCISGINFPTTKRDYLMGLVKEVAVKHKVKFIIVAGNTVDGKALEVELKAYIRNNIVGLKAKDKENKKFELEKEFITDQAHALNHFIPHIPDANYHVVISDKVYDRPIGARILEELQKLRGGARGDVRLIGRQEDGTYDAEPKIPGGMKGFEEIRVIVPRRQPWFYRIITSFMQTLINRFIPRTFSPPPQLIVVGCTGTAAYLPYYDGVPSISVPVLHKISEQLSTENMVGCSVIKVISENSRTRIISGVYDFRPAIFNEKQFAIPSDLSTTEADICNALIPSEVSFKILLFRVNSQRKKMHKRFYEEVKVKTTLEVLKTKKLVTFTPESNRYAISAINIQSARISLGTLFQGSREVKHTVASCMHIGCLKTLYHTAIYYLPKRMAESDVFIENGDLVQGMAHNYEYNGDVLPILRGFDRQEIMAAHLRARNFLDVFKIRYEKVKKQNLKADQILRACLIRYEFNSGNHDAWKFYNKDTLILYLFESQLKSRLLDGLVKLCREYNINAEYTLIKSIIDEKIGRVGESRIVNLDGVVVGIKHPFKGRTQSKSHRIQDVVDFTWRTFSQFTAKVSKDAKGFALAYIANFHECAAVHVVKYGRTVFGLMTGAYLHDTSFESNLDKVVDYGSAQVRAIIDPDDRLLYSEVEYDNYIHPKDEKIVLADKIDTSDVSDLCEMLTKEIYDLPWRH